MRIPMKIIKNQEPDYNDLNGRDEGTIDTITTTNSVF
jgi:hypothetical protein